MNIPQVPPDGWTRPFLNQLRACADSVDPGPTNVERLELAAIWHVLSEDQRDVLLDTTTASFHEFERTQGVMMTDRQSPEKWVNYLLAVRRHERNKLSAARQIFCTPGVQSQGMTAKQLALL